MTDSAAERHENGGASDGSHLPDAIKMDNTMTGASTYSGPGLGRLVFVPDGDGGSWYLESEPNTPTFEDHESTDRPVFSDANEHENWESNSSTPGSDRGEVADHPDHSGVMVDDSGDFGNDTNAITHGDNHVFDNDSSVSDADDADNSGDFQTCPNTPEPDQQPLINESFFSDASDVSNTAIEMESSQRSETRLGSPLPYVSETDNPGHLNGSTSPSEVGGDSKCPADSGKRIASDDGVIGNRQPLLSHRRRKSSSSSC